MKKGGFLYRRGSEGRGTMHDVRQINFNSLIAEKTVRMLVERLLTRQVDF